MSSQNQLFDQAANILRAGGLVAFPTETVYGLGADTDNEDAVRKIFAAKGRPADHPVIVHLQRGDQIDAWAIDIPPSARKLADAFWPGPLTMILKRSNRAKDVVTGGLDTVGLRVPRHPVAQELLARFGGAIAAPSANRFGRVSPTTAEHVRQEFGDEVNLILDGGDCEVGLESTIVDLSGDVPVILRPGCVTAEQVEQATGMPLGTDLVSLTRCAGRLASHYAPRAAVEVVPTSGVAARFLEITSSGRCVSVLSPVMPPGVPAEAWIPMPERLDNYGRRLYSVLRQVDEAGIDVALITPPPEEGIGVAIGDRLRKASAPRNGP